MDCLERNSNSMWALTVHVTGMNEEGQGNISSVICYQMKIGPYISRAFLNSLEMDSWKR